VTATGAVPFTVAARFTFDAQTRRLGYDIALPAASLEQIAGVYLHRRVNRPNGGVAHILAKSASARVDGAVTLSQPEATDLKAGKLYLAVVGKTDPHLSARGSGAPRLTTTGEQQSTWASSLLTERGGRMGVRERHRSGRHVPRTPRFTWIH
jgi:hypothetical protein